MTIYPEEVSVKTAIALGTITGLDPAEITGDMTIEGDLGLDSMDTVLLLVALEDEFDVDICDEVYEDAAPSTVKGLTEFMIENLRHAGRLGEHTNE